MGNKTLVTKIGVIFLLILLMCLIVWIGLVKILDKVSFKKGNSVNYKEAQTEISLNSGTIPNDFPKDFPLYPNAKIVSSWKNASDNSDGFSLVLESEDSIEVVASYYNKELGSIGWNIDKSMGSIQTKETNSTTLSFNKSGSKGFIGLVENGRGVIISLSLGVDK